MKIGVLQGNGIGPEIVAAAMRVVDACGLDLEWVDIPVAERAIEKWGAPISAEAVDMARELKVTLKGPISVEKGKGRVTCVHKDGSMVTHCSFNNALRHIGEPCWADIVERCTREVLSEGLHTTPDVGGKAGTDEFTDAVIEKINRQKVLS